MVVKTDQVPALREQKTKTAANRMLLNNDECYEDGRADAWIVRLQGSPSQPELGPLTVGWGAAALAGGFLAEGQCAKA
jgi:hypothetical protein